MNNPEESLSRGERARRSFLETISGSAALGLDIKIGNTAELGETIKSVIDDGVDIEPRLCSEIFQGISNGSTWAVQKYNFRYKPQYRLTTPDNVKLGKKGPEFNPYINRICITKDWLERLDSSMLGCQYPIVDGSGFHAGWLSHQQKGEWVGVEETVHFLQWSNAVDELVVIHDDEILPATTPSLLIYYRQPHEYEAMQHIFQYFKEIYGENPLPYLEQELG